MVQARDTVTGRNEIRVVYDRANAYVFIETTGNHDGTRVCTTVRLDRQRFVDLVRDLGVL